MDDEIDVLLEVAVKDIEAGRWRQVDHFARLMAQAAVLIRQQSAEGNRKDEQITGLMVAANAVRAIYATPNHNPDVMHLAINDLSLACIAVSGRQVIGSLPEDEAIAAQRIGTKGDKSQ